MLLVSLTPGETGWTAACDLTDEATVMVQASTASAALEALRRAASLRLVELLAAAGVRLTPSALAWGDLRVRAACTVALAQLTPAPLPPADGFGTDVSTFPDLDPELRVISGPRVVAEAVARRWCTERGQLLGDPSYGDVDLRALLNATVTAEQLTTLAARLEAQALEDERVERCAVVVTTAGAHPRLSLTVRASIVTAGGPFAFVLRMDQQAAALSLELKG